VSLAIPRWTLSALSGVAIWLVWVAPSQESILDVSSETAGAILLVVLMFEGLWWSVANNRPLLGFTWGFGLVFFAFIPLLQITSKSYPLPVIFSLVDLKHALFVNVAFVIAFRVGSARCGRVSNASRFVPSAIRYRRLAIVATMLWFLAATAGTVSLGVSWLFSTRSAAGVDFGELGSSATIVAVTGSIQIILAWGAIMGILAAKHYRKLGLSVLVGLMVIWTMIWINPMSSPRYVCLSVYGTIIMALVPTNWKRFDVFAALVLPVFLVTVFPILGVTRNAESMDRGFRVEADSFLVNGLARNPDFDAFQMGVNAQSYVASNGHTFGRQLIGAAFTFIPRQIWPDKPLPSGAIVGAAAGYQNLNLSMPLPAELWIDFGLLGVVAGGAFFGVFLGAIGRRLASWRRQGVGNALTGVSLLALWLQFIVLRGSLGAVSGRIIVLALLTLLAVAVGGPVYTRKSDPVSISFSNSEASKMYLPRIVTPYSVLVQVKADRTG